jgi:tetratricopeptide (TPR) repeat protein
VLALVSVLALLARRRCPYLVVGWLWYLGTLVPVIGLIQVGEQAMADRYTCVPLVGVFLMLAWGLPDLLAWWRLPAGVLVFPALLLLFACFLLTLAQIPHWAHSRALWEQALKVAAGNATAHNGLGMALQGQNDLEGAADHFATALKIRRGDFPAASVNLGLLAQQQGRLEEAADYYLQAVEKRPDMASAHANLGVVRYLQGRLDEAGEAFRTAAGFQPDRPRYHFHLARVLQAQGQTQAALAEYQEGLRLDPNWAEEVDRAAWSQATQKAAHLRRGAEAVLLATEACEATGNTEPRFLDTLAAAYAEVGRFDAARDTAGKALALASAAGRRGLAAQIEARLRLYERSQPFRDN